MLQMKEKGKTLEEKKKTNEMEISNLPDKEFKAMVIECSLNLGEQGRHSEKFHNERENIRNFQTEYTELKYTSEL